MNGYITTITSHEIQSGGMSASVSFADDLETALSRAAADVEATPDEYVILNITISIEPGIIE